MEKHPAHYWRDLLDVNKDLGARIGKAAAKKILAAIVPCGNIELILI